MSAFHWHQVKFLKNQNGYESTAYRLTPPRVLSIEHIRAHMKKKRNKVSVEMGNEREVKERRQGIVRF